MSDPPPTARLPSVFEDDSMPDDLPKVTPHEHDPSGDPSLTGSVGNSSGNDDNAVVEPVERELRKVHWKKKERNSPLRNSSQTNNSTTSTQNGSEKHEMDTDDLDVTPDVRKAASRLVRAHTGRVPIRSTPPDEDLSEEERGERRRTSVGDESESESSSSSEATLPLPRRSARRRRSYSSRASSDYDEEASSAWSSEAGDTDTDSRRDLDIRGGVLSSLLRLYRSGPREEHEEGKINGRGSLHPLLDGKRSRESNGKRRRWSASSLFAVESRESRRRSARRSSDRSSDRSEIQGETSTARVHPDRKHQTLPHRSQDYNEPYIPSPHLSHPLRPSVDITVIQRIRKFGNRMLSLSSATGSHADSGARPSTAKGTNRTIVALIVSTSGLAAVASPPLAHLAPATGADAETSDGRRKISRYEGVNEIRAREQDEDALDEAEGVMESHHRSSSGDIEGEEGRTNDSGPNKDKSSRKRALLKEMEEGAPGSSSRYKDKKRKRRGKRTQTEMVITRNIASIIQRKK